VRAIVVHRPDGTVVAAAVHAGPGGPRPVADADTALVELDFPAHLQDRPLDEVFASHRVDTERGVLVEIERSAD
jgi:hypothetical protein